MMGLSFRIFVQANKEMTMKIKIPKRFIWAFIFLILVSLACQGTSAPTATPAPDTQSEASQPTNPPQLGVAPVSLPEKRENQAGDPDSSANAKRKLVSSGEKFVKGIYERPFNAVTMDTYFPYLDIVDTQGFKDEEWGYATISLSGTDANGKLPGTYGVELDLNRDGRGEWLILAANPTSTDWSTQGVQAWNDANGDIGGSAPTIADENSPGNGYESLVFDQGKGNNVDDAWAHVSAEDPKTIIIAFRLSLLGNPDSFAMGSWAGSKSYLIPALFDFNDHMTHMDAGSPLPDLYVYPLKKLAEIDNTCRLAIGFFPSGNEPGLCETIIHQEPGVPVVGCTPPAAGIMNPCP